MRERVIMNFMNKIHIAKLYEIELKTLTARNILEKLNIDLI